MSFRLFQRSLRQRVHFWLVLGWIGFVVGPLYALSVPKIGSPRFVIAVTGLLSAGLAAILGWTAYLGNTRRRSLRRVDSDLLPQCLCRRCQALVTPLLFCGECGDEPSLPRPLDLPPSKCPSCCAISLGTRADIRSRRFEHRCPECWSQLRSRSPIHPTWVVGILHPRDFGQLVQRVRYHLPHLSMIRDLTVSVLPPVEGTDISVCAVDLSFRGARQSPDNDPLLAALGALWIGPDAELLPTARALDAFMRRSSNQLPLPREIPILVADPDPPVALRRLLEGRLGRVHYGITEEIVRAAHPAALRGMTMPVEQEKISEQGTSTIPGSDRIQRKSPRADTGQVEVRRS